MLSDGLEVLLLNAYSFVLLIESLTKITNLGLKLFLDLLDAF